jgi:dTDP-4-dehydrorhamnose 3,5-epimerase
VARPLLIKPKRFTDERGWFVETYKRRDAAERGLGEEFVQDNHSLSQPAGTLRGLHFQTPPHAQAKLVRCIRGRIMDYVVDVRRGSPTYGRYVAVELTADNGWQLYVPIGFAHGFLTLEPDCEVAYKVSDYYAPAHDAGIRWNDPAIGITWPLPPSGPVLSPKDERLPLLAEFNSPFAYDGEPLPPQLVD